MSGSQRVHTDEPRDVAPETMSEVSGTSGYWELGTGGPRPRDTADCSLPTDCLRRPTDSSLSCAEGGGDVRGWDSRRVPESAKGLTGG